MGKMHGIGYPPLGPRPSCTAWGGGGAVPPRAPPTTEPIPQHVRVWAPHRKMVLHTPLPVGQVAHTTCLPLLPLLPYVTKACFYDSATDPSSNPYFPFINVVPLLNDTCHAMRHIVDMGYSSESGSTKTTFIVCSPSCSTTFLSL